MKAPIAVASLLALAGLAASAIEKPEAAIAHTNAIAYNPVSRKIYALDQRRSEVVILDTRSGTTRNVAVGTAPVSLAVNVRNGRVYVASSTAATVSVLDPNTDALVATVKVERRPYSIAVNPATGIVYTTHTFSDKISIIDPKTNTAAPLKTGSVDLIAIDSSANVVYLLSYESGHVTVLDGERLTLTRREAGKHAWGMAVDEHTLYVARMGTGDVKALGTEETVIPAGETTSSIAINSKTHTVYAGNYASADVTVIEDRRPVATMRVGEHPQALAIDEVRNLVFAANTQNDSVTVIDGATRKALATLPAGPRPYALAVVPGSKKVYVANGAGDTPLTVVPIPD